MFTIMPALDTKSPKPLYIQLYEYIKNAVMSKNIVPGEKLPSLRNLSESLALSITTVEMAYNQLAVEGYIYSIPQAGFFISEMHYPRGKSDSAGEVPVSLENAEGLTDLYEKYDVSCFDFPKWKKCMNYILNDYPQLLLLRI